MPTTNELDARLRAIENENAEQRGRRSSSKDWRNYISAAALMLAAWTLYEVHHLGVQVAALNTLVTGKVSALALSTAINPTLAVKSYATVSSILQDSSHAKQAVPPSTADALAKTLAQQAPTNAGIPEYWVLAGQLINSKTQLAVANQTTHDCFQAPKGAIVGPLIVTHPNRPIQEDIAFQDCTLRLDDPDYEQSWLAKNAAKDLKIWPSANYNYVLQNVRVTYGGGKLIPITTMRFINCTFDFRYSAVPLDSPAKSLGVQLLTENLLQPEFTVNLAAGTS